MKAAVGEKGNIRWRKQASACGINIWWHQILDAKRRTNAICWPISCLDFFCVSPGMHQREPACCMAAGSRKFDITQNKRYSSSFFPSLVSLLLFMSVQSTYIVFTKHSHFEMLFLEVNVYLRVMAVKEKNSFQKSFQKQQTVLEVY